MKFGGSWNSSDPSLGMPSVNVPVLFMVKVDAVKRPRSLMKNGWPLPFAPLSTNL